MSQLSEAMHTPWKASNQLASWLTYFPARLLFALHGIPWGRGWHFYGLPIIQKHRQSVMLFGSNLNLRSSVRSNPLGPNHPVILCTWNPDAVLTVGDNFAMTGGSICAAERILIGDNVTVGANCTIADTDFHPLRPEERTQHPQDGKSSPVLIDDEVFIGMNSLILKGVTIGCGSVVGAGSVVTRDVPPHVVVAGNPARVLKELSSIKL